MHMETLVRVLDPLEPLEYREATHRSSLRGRDSGLQGWQDWGKVLAQPQPRLSGSDEPHQAGGDDPCVDTTPSKEAEMNILRGRRQ